MSVTVTLHVYSGLPDPAWELSSSEVESLLAQLGSLRQQTLAKPPGLRGQLGYRGFSLDANREAGFSPQTYVHRGIVDPGHLAPSLLADRDLELWLLQSAGRVLTESQHADVRDRIDTQFASRTDLTPFIEPVYDPGKWNNDAQIKRLNNCYNYGNDKITNTKAQPGRGSGQEAPYPPTCDGTGEASVRDGLRRVANISNTPAEGHYAALVTTPTTVPLPDFHWYRRDRNNMWSHKAGETAATNLDQSNRPISDPETCDRGDYTRFCGYFHCIPANVTIR